MEKSWLVGLGFGLSALAALTYIWWKLIGVEASFDDDDDYTTWNDEQ